MRKPFIILPSLDIDKQFRIIEIMMIHTVKSKISTEGEGMVKSSWLGEMELFPTHLAWQSDRFFITNQMYSTRFIYAICMTIEMLFCA